MYLLPIIPKSCNQHLVTSITVSSPETSYVHYIRMLSPVYQYLFSLVLSFLIRICPGVLKNVSVPEHRVAPNNEMFCVKIYNSNTIIVILM